MASPKQQIFEPVGGMNQDDSIIAPTRNYAGRNAFGEGDYKYLLNARVGSSNSDNVGDVEVIKGTTEVSSYFVRSAAAWIAGSRPAGTEKVIGRLEDKENRRLYYSVYNSSGNHCIRYYDGATDAVYELLKWSGLSFASTYFVAMAIIDNWLVITDRNNAPRIIDVETISDLYNTLTTDFREYHISFHKWGPVMPPVIKAYYDGSTDNYDQFENKVIQFSYRYIYEGRLKSRWSPISNSYAAQYRTTATTGDEITSIRIGIPGFNLDVPESITQYNYFGNNNTKFTNAVQYIEIAYRESSKDLWRLFTRHNVAASGNTEFDYEGTSNGVPIPDDDFYQLFDTVPFLAGAVEAIDNRFVFGDCLDEHDAASTPIVTDIGVTSVIEGGHGTSWWSAGFNGSGVGNTSRYTGMSAADANEYGQRVMLNQTTFKGRGRYKLAIQWLAANGWRSAAYTTDDWVYEIEAEADVVEKLYAFEFKLDAAFTPPDYAVAYQIMRTNCLNIDYFLFGSVNSFTYLIDDAAAYPDNLEVPSTVRDRIRQHFENARTVTGLAFSKYLKTLGDKPIYHSLVSDVRRTTATTTLADASRLYIDINNWYNSSKKNVGATQNNPVNKLFYNYREGDRVRFLASLVAVPGAGDKTVYDVPILEFTGKGIIIEKPKDILWLPDASGTNPDDYLIEVYTPHTPTSDDYVYYETGEWYPVLYPGTASRDLSKRDWTYTNQASITCTTYGDVKVFNKRPFAYGDCHAIAKIMYLDIKTSGLIGPQFWLPSMNPDVERTYDVWEKSNGRAAPAYTDLPVANFKPTQLRFGGQIVEESFVNQLTRFKEADQKIYPSEYGRIRGLVATANAQVESVGTIMLAIGEREAFSIYVNRTTLEDLSGRTQVTISDKILGSYNTLLGSHGTLNPESISVHRGRVYYWDAVNGTWVRYGRDGLTAISSKYKMRSWHKSISNLIIGQYGSAENPLAVSEFDPYYEELVTYNNHSTLPATFRDYDTYKGAAFSEDDTRWKYIHSFTPELFGKLSDQLISFRAGGIYKHNTNDTYRTFYGTQYDVKIEPVFNNIPKDHKSWQTITIIASHRWSVERFLSEYRGAKTKQQSSIALDNFEDIEDGYYAAIKMDQNTPLASYPMITGNKMRSKALRALLKLDPSITTLSLLHYVLVGQIDSPKNS